MYLKIKFFQILLGLKKAMRKQVMPVQIIRTLSS